MKRGKNIFYFIFLGFFLLPVLTIAQQGPPGDFEGGDGSPNNPYQISSCNQLEKTRNSLSSHFILLNDIDCSETENWRGGQGFMSIGTGTGGGRFSGVFDGDNFEITGLSINRGNVSYQGLFGSVHPDGIIKNLGLDNINIGGGHYSGGLVGRNYGTIENSYSKGVITTHRSYVGGLVGANEEAGSINDSYSEVDLTSSSSLLGGLVGDNEGVISNSHAAGDVYGRGNYIGGLAGMNRGLISDSHAAGDVTLETIKTYDSDGKLTSETHTVGGLVGIAYNNISNSYATGDVKQIGSSVRTGGLVGWTLWARILNSYATGDINGHSRVGGLIGENRESIILGSNAVGDIRGSSHYVGGLVGYAPGTIIKDSYASGDVYGSNSFVGGLVGWISKVDDSLAGVHGSYASGNVTGGRNYAGGLVGYLDGSVNYSYATGNVVGTDYVGGLVGYLHEDVVSDSYSLGEVSGDGSRVGGFIGRIWRWSANDSFWNVDNSNIDGIGCCGWREKTAVGKTTAEMKDVITFTHTITYGLSKPWRFVGLFEDGVWNIDESGEVNDGYPFLVAIEGIYEPLFDPYEFELFEGGDGSADNPYQINSCTQLQNMKAAISSHFILLNDIDCSETLGWNDGLGFEPIGNLANEGFLGSLDGQGYKIINLYINNPKAVYMGLFGFARSGTIKDLKLENVNVTGSGFVGGLSGELNGVVDNVSVSGVVTGISRVGGLAGKSGGTILYGHSKASVSGENRVGGLVGFTDGTVMNSYSSGDVTGSEDRVGGLIGATGEKVHQDSIKARSKILNSYSVGLVNNMDKRSGVGGLIGHNDGETLIESSFWDIQTSGQTSSAGGIGKNTSEMKTKSTFESADWNFNGMWEIEERNYPHLKEKISLFSIKKGRALFLINSHLGRPDPESILLPADIPPGIYNINILTADGDPKLNYREEQIQPQEFAYIKLFDEDKNLIAETRKTLNLSDFVRFVYHEDTVATNISIPKKVAYVQFLHGASPEELEANYNSMRFTYISFDLLSNPEEEGESICSLNRGRAVAEIREKDRSYVRIRSDKTSWEARIRRIAEIGLEEGSYNINLAATDGYSNRGDHEQPEERYHLRFFDKNMNMIGVTESTSDLEDKVDYVYQEETVEEDFFISKSFKYFDAFHSFFPDQNPNSLDVVCVSFDNFTPARDDGIIISPSSIMTFGETRQVKGNQNLYWHADGVLGGDGLSPDSSGSIEPNPAISATYTAPYKTKQVTIDNRMEPDGNIRNEALIYVREPYNRLTCQPEFQEEDHKIWLGWNPIHSNPYYDHILRLYQISPGGEVFLGEFESWRSGSYLQSGLERDTSYTYELGVKYLEGPYGVGEEFRISRRSCKTLEGASDAPSRVRAFAYDNNTIFVNWKDNVTLPNSNYFFEVQRMKITPSLSTDLLMKQNEDFPEWLSLSWKNNTGHIPYFQRIEYSVEKDPKIRFTESDETRSIINLGEVWDLSGEPEVREFSHNLNVGDVLREGAVIYIRQAACSAVDFVDWPYMEEERAQMILNKGHDGQPKPPCSDYKFFDFIMVEPESPSGLIVDGKTHDSIALEWTDNSEREDGFEIERWRGGSIEKKIEIGPSSPRSYTGVINHTDGGLILNTSYEYRIRAFSVSDDGTKIYSGFSNMVSVTTDAQPAGPHAPTNLSASEIGHDSIALEWTDNSEREDGFEIERWRGGSIEKKIEIGPSSPRSYTGVINHTDTELLSETGYSYRVRAFINDSQAGRVYSGFSNTINVITRGLGSIDIKSFIEGEEIFENGDCRAILKRQGTDWESAGDCVRTEENLIPANYELSWDEGYPPGAARVGEPDIEPVSINLDYEEDAEFVMSFAEEVILSIKITLEEEHLDPLRGALVRVNLPGGEDFACTHSDQPCDVDYPRSFSVRAEAVSWGGYSFNKWIEGPCENSVNRVCNFDISDNLSINADFVWGGSAWFRPGDLLANTFRSASRLLGNIYSSVAGLFERVDRESVVLQMGPGGDDGVFRSHYESVQVFQPPIPFYRDEGLETDTVYLYRVRVVYPDGSTSPWSMNEAMVKTMKNKEGGSLPGGVVAGICTRNSFCDKSADNIGFGLRSSIDSERDPDQERSEQQCTLNIHCHDVGRSDIRFIER